MKKIVSIIFALLFFSVSLYAQLPYPNQADVNVSVATDYTLPSNLDPMFLTDSTVYKMVVLSSDGLTVIDSADFMYDNINGNVVAISTTLDYNTTYQWNVWDKGTPPTVGLQTYTVFPFTFTTVFEVLSPADSSTNVSVFPKFEWNDFPGIDDYTIEFSAGDSSLSNSIEVNASNSTQSGNVLYYTSEGDTGFPLTANKTYYCRIKYNDGSNDRFSNISGFTTPKVLSITKSNPAANSSVTGYDPLQFAWYINSAIGDIKFRLQILEDPGQAPVISDWNSTSVIEYSNINQVYKSVTGLHGSTTYYWRVTAYYNSGSVTGGFDADDAVIKISSVSKFTTKGGAVKAYLSYPVNNEKVFSLRPSFYWYTNEQEADASFELIIATDPPNAGVLNSGLVASSPINAGSAKSLKLTSDLTASTKYYWQVKTHYLTKTNISVVDSFVTDAIGVVTAFKPTQSYPTDKVLVYTTSPKLWYWVNGVSDELDFIIEVEDTISGAVAGSPYTATALNKQINGLTAGKTYKWRVKSFETGNSSNSSAFSDWEFFTVAGGGLSQAVASYPVDNPTVFSQTPTVLWYVQGSSLGFDNFTVKLYHDASNSGAPADWAVQPVTATITSANTYSFTFDTLQSGEKYYWAVAFDDGVSPAPVHADYAQGAFTVAGGSQTEVILTAPSDLAVVYSTSVALNWSLNGSALGIDKYRVTYSNTKAFVDDTIYTKKVETTDKKVTAANLLHGATYYWFVEISYDGGSTWVNKSNTFEFTVHPGSFSVVPKIGSPDNGIRLVDGSPVLSWLLPANSDSKLIFDVQVADNPDFNNAVEYSDLNNLNERLNKLGEGHYYWRVRSKVSGNKNGDVSLYSNPGRFRIGDAVTDVHEKEIIPEQLKLEQNYPNPFNPETVIRYSVPENTSVSLKIYDILGNEVATLVDRELPAGVYSSVWRAKDASGRKVSSGVYIYRLSANGLTFVKKMQFIK